MLGDLRTGAGPLYVRCAGLDCVPRMLDQVTAALVAVHDRNVLVHPRQAA